MATATWSTPGTRSSNLAGTALNSLSDGSRSSQVTYDNSSALNLYASVAITLGSFTPGTNPTITLHVQSTDGTATPDNEGGDAYVIPITTGAGVKNIVVPMVRLYPYSMRLAVTNDAGAALASSGHSIYVTPYGESIA